VKKVFKIQQTKLKPNRAVDAIKNELRKYIKREKKKTLPNKEKMYWDFECKFGQSEELALPCEFDEIIHHLNSVVEKNWTECYIEIMAKAVDKPTKEETTKE